MNREQSRPGAHTPTHAHTHGPNFSSNRFTKIALCEMIFRTCGTFFNIGLLMHYQNSIKENFFKIVKNHVEVILVHSRRGMHLYSLAWCTMYSEPLRHVIVKIILKERLFNRFPDVVHTCFLQPMLFKPFIASLLIGIARNYFLFRSLFQRCPNARRAAEHSLKWTKCPAVRNLHAIGIERLFQTGICLEMPNDSTKIILVFLMDEFQSLCTQPPVVHISDLAIFWYPQAWKISSLTTRNSFQKCFTYLSKHQTLLRGLYEVFWGNSVNISDGRVYLVYLRPCPSVRNMN